MNLFSNPFWAIEGVLVSAPTYISTGGYSGTSSPSSYPRAVLNAPNNLVAGNTLIAVVSFAASVSSFSPKVGPAGLNLGSGWTIITAISNTIFGGVGLVLFKTVSASEPTSYTFSMENYHSSVSGGSGQIFQFEKAYWTPNLFTNFFSSGNTITGNSLIGYLNYLSIFLAHDLSGTNIPTLPSGYSSLSASSETTNNTSLRATMLPIQSSGTVPAPSCTTTDNLSRVGAICSNFILGNTPIYTRVYSQAFSVTSTVPANPVFNAPAGSLIVVTLLFQSQGGVSPTVTDTAGNLYLAAAYYTDPNGNCDSQTFYVLSSKFYNNNQVQISGITASNWMAAVACYTKASGSWSYDTTYSVTAAYQNSVSSTMSLGNQSIVVGACGEYYTGNTVVLYSYPAQAVTQALSANGQAVNSLEFFNPKQQSVETFIFDVYPSKGYGGISTLRLESFI